MEYQSGNVNSHLLSIIPHRVIQSFLVLSCRLHMFVNDRPFSQMLSTQSATNSGTRDGEIQDPKLLNNILNRCNFKITIILN